MKFLIDAQLPPRLCPWLESRGCSAVHVSETTMGIAATDAEIWELARREDWVILSKDSDFFERSTVLGHPPRVLYIRVGNCSNRDLLTLLESRWRDIFDALEAMVPLIHLTRSGLDLFDLKRKSEP
ncbi:MAG TPA: DUF5615 family PIN-like protein [Thermoanaerobaculia bacterium]